MNLVLIGFMGTGKTSIAKRAAKELGYNFVDTDLEVEKLVGMSVKDIFQKLGETRFRSEETAAVARAAAGDKQVISTGGGVVLNPVNLQTLKANGLVIGLTAEPEVILERVSRRNTRPLLKVDNLMETIKEMLIQRGPLYGEADIMVDTSKKGLPELTQEVVRLFKERIGR